jgi:hypothetical protein
MPVSVDPRSYLQPFLVPCDEPQVTYGGTRDGSCYAFITSIQSIELIKCLITHTNTCKLISGLMPLSPAIG